MKLAGDSAVKTYKKGKTEKSVKKKAKNSTKVTKNDKPNETGNQSSMPMLIAQSQALISQMN